MKFVPTELSGVLLIEPDVFRDPRGYFLETYQERKYREGGVPDQGTGGVPSRFVQDNQSRSARGSLRGLHAQLEPPQGKLVRAISGRIFDVAVDIRRGSPTFGRFVAAEISGDDFRQIWIPPGFAHGFCVLSEEAVVEYKTTAFYRPEGEIAVAWNDPDIGVPWPVAEPILSERDRRAPPLSELGERLPAYAAGAG